MSGQCRGLDAAFGSLSGWPLALVLVTLIAACTFGFWVVWR